MKIIISFFSAHAVQNEFYFNLLLLLVVVFCVSNLIVVVYAVVKTNRFLLTGCLKTHVENFPRSENFYYFNSVIVRNSKVIKTITNYKQQSFGKKRSIQNRSLQKWVLSKSTTSEKGHISIMSYLEYWSPRKKGHFEIKHFGKGSFENHFVILVTSKSITS